MFSTLVNFVDVKSYKNKWHRHFIPHFLCLCAGSGASTYTLDSGIGTFPLPDCSSSAAGRGLSKTRAGAEHHSSGSPGRAGRRARTLDRELPSQEDCYAPHKQLIPTIQYGSMLEGRSSTGVIREGANHLHLSHTISSGRFRSEVAGLSYTQPKHSYSSQDGYQGRPLVTSQCGCFVLFAELLLAARSAAQLIVFVVSALYLSVK